jgi:hypothetical protein
MRAPRRIPPVDGATLDCIGCTIVAALMGLLLGFAWDLADAVVKGVGVTVVGSLLALGAWQKVAARLRRLRHGAGRCDGDGLHRQATRGPG